jgi:D-sedoheptulose 7-phosphate isomerase
LGNAKGYDSIFVEQLIGQLTAGDVVIGISTSGNSSNILLAIEYAHDYGAATIGLIGFGGGRLKTLVDKAIVLSSRSYQQVEDMRRRIKAGR